MRWLNDILAMPAASQMTLLRARALSAAGDLHAWIDDPQAYLRFADEALAIFRELGDAAALPTAIESLGWARRLELPSYTSITETTSEPACATYTFEAVATSPTGFWPTGGNVVTSRLVLVSITDTLFSFGAPFGTSAVFVT